MKKRKVKLQKKVLKKQIKSEAQRLLRSPAVFLFCLA